MKKDITILIKGAGEIASGIAWRLYQCHFKVVMTEVAKPIAVRRAVSFCEVIYDGRKQVEGVEAILATGTEDIYKAWENRRLPVIIDPEMKILKEIKPDVLLEATLSKRNTGISITDAPLVIGLGPGYEAGRDAHYVVETNRGHHLGRVFTTGTAEPNTGIPGEMAGVTYERVLRAPTEGIFETWLKIGDSVKKGKTIAKVGDEPVIAKVDGILRGLIRPGISVRKGLKIGDIDPRANSGYVLTISEKARAVCGAVLEAVLRTYNT
jgi:xanthine dehydrogenase accessory factor